MFEWGSDSSVVSREIVLLRLYLIEKDQKAAFVGHKLRKILWCPSCRSGGVNQLGSWMRQLRDLAGRDPFLTFGQIGRTVSYLVNHPSPVHNRVRAIGRLAWRQFRKRVILGTIIFQWHGMAFEVFLESRCAGSVYYLDMPDWWEMSFLKRLLRPRDVVADVREYWRLQHAGGLAGRPRGEGSRF